MLLLILISFQVYASEEQGKWIRITKKDGIEIFTKQTSESPIQYLRAKGKVSAKVENICAIMRNVEHATDWTPNLVERSYVKNISDTEAILYDVSDMPWPVKDREMVLYHELSITDDKEFLVLNFKSIDEPSAKRDQDMVRAKVHHGEIRFKPVDGGSRTFIEMIILVDPKGSLPIWLVNLLQVSIPHDFLMALNQYAEKTEFKPLPGVQSLIDQLVRE